MNVWSKRLAQLGVAGACLMVTGCGGGDVPDPSDSRAAGDAPPAAAENAPPVVARVAGPKADAAAPEAPAQAQAPAAKPQGGSTTSEMLAMSGTNPPPAGGSTPPPAGSPAAPPGGAAGTPAPAAPGGGSPNSGPAAGGRVGGAPGMAMGPGAGMGIPQGPDMGKMQNEMKARMAAGAGGMAPGAGAAGAAGAASATGADSGPADFHSPTAAVTSFLNALKAKDLDRLNESTALRASREASSKNQGLFQKIIDLELSDSELDDLAKKLEGFKVVGDNPAKSTGRATVVLQKAGSGNGFVRRTITVRREKKGWGVMDIGGPSDFKMPGMMPQRKKTGY